MCGVINLRRRAQLIQHGSGRKEGFLGRQNWPFRIQPRQLEAFFDLGPTLLQDGFDAIRRNHEAIGRKVIKQ